MAEVVHRDVEIDHVHDNTGNNSSNAIIGLIVLLIVLFLFFYYGLPLIRGAASSVQAPQVNVPSSLNVNVHSTK